MRRWQKVTVGHSGLGRSASAAVLSAANSGNPTPKSHKQWPRMGGRHCWLDPIVEGELAPCLCLEHTGRATYMEVSEEAGDLGSLLKRCQHLLGMLFIIMIGQVISVS